MNAQAPSFEKALEKAKEHNLILQALFVIIQKLDSIEARLTKLEGNPVWEK